MAQDPKDPGTKDMFQGPTEPGLYRLEVRMSVQARDSLLKLKKEMEEGVGRRISMNTLIVEIIQDFLNRSQ